jgi:hypothetical protein
MMNREFRDELLRDLTELMEDLTRIESLLKTFEKKYGMSSEEFAEKFDKMELKPERDFISWHAHYLGYKGLLKRRDELFEKLGLKF